LARLAARFPAIGDDAAVLEDGLVASADVLVEGVDWRPEWSSPADVGWKAIMVNASDIAAMGGRPTAFLISLVVSRGFDVDAFYDGVEEACAVVGGEVVGGDLSAGHAEQPIMRSGAGAGDAVWVSGPLGAAARDLRMGGGGLAHRRPTAYVGPRPDGATAMIDVSDGLIADCAHIADASGVRVALDRVPVADVATIDDALHGGDDYVLVACGPVQLPGWIRIGTCTEGAGVTYKGEAIAPRGWEHAL
jgi:thiamine-monophosphate kinase